MDLFRYCFENRMIFLSNSRMVDENSIIIRNSSEDCTDININEDYVEKFRDAYRRLSEVDHFDEHHINEDALCDAAREIKLKNNSDFDRKLLRECVKSEDIEMVFLNVITLYHNEMHMLQIRSTPIVSPPAQHPPSQLNIKTASVDDKHSTLTEILCKLTIKRWDVAVHDFVTNYLLRDVSETDGTK